LENGTNPLNLREKKNTHCLQKSATGGPSSRPSLECCPGGAPFFFLAGHGEGRATAASCPLAGGSRLFFSPPFNTLQVRRRFFGHSCGKQKLSTPKKKKTVADGQPGLRRLLHMVVMSLRPKKQIVRSRAVILLLGGQGSNNGRAQTSGLFPPRQLMAASDGSAFGSAGHCLMGGPPTSVKPSRAPLFFFF